VLEHDTPCMTGELVLANAVGGPHDVPFIIT
jgi:hypothetical protein